MARMSLVFCIILGAINGQFESEMDIDNCHDCVRMRTAVPGISRDWTSQPYCCRATDPYTMD